jgi:neutral ceramidase
MLGPYSAGSSFLLVDRSAGSDWVTVMDDGNWETKLYWQRENKTMSYITAQWNIPEWMAPGTYRITHQGYAKPSPLSSKLVAYSGTSRPFVVTA